MNQYLMPFGAFCGVNHMHQTIFFACGLLSSEKVNAFVWMFEWFVLCCGCAPSALIIDQDPAIANVVQFVFQSTTRRYCLWLIMNKLSDKLDGIKDEAKAIENRNKVVHVSDCELDFETQWNDMLLTYVLSSNEWLHSIFDIHTKWVPMFMNKTFFAGMNST